MKLTDFDPETWVGKIVRFTQASGPRSKGKKGRVLRAGGGWVTVEVAAEGKEKEEVSGRSYNIVVEEEGGGEGGAEGELRGSGGAAEEEGEEEEEEEEQRVQRPASTGMVEGHDEGGGGRAAAGIGKEDPRAESADDEEEQEQQMEEGEGRREGDVVTALHENAMDATVVALSSQEGSEEGGRYRVGGEGGPRGERAMEGSASQLRLCLRCSLLWRRKRRREKVGKRRRKGWRWWP